MSETAHWNKVLAPYARPRIGRSALDLATSVVPYLGLTALLYVLYGDIPWWALGLIMIPTGGFMLRTFIVFHDCGHGSFMPTKERTAGSGGSPRCWSGSRSRTGASTTPCIMEPRETSIAAARATCRR